MPAAFTFLMLQQPAGERKSKRRRRKRRRRSRKQEATDLGAALARNYWAIAFPAWAVQC